MGNKAGSGRGSLLMCFGRELDEQSNSTVEQRVCCAESVLDLFSRWEVSSCMHKGQQKKLR